MVSTNLIIKQSYKKEIFISEIQVRDEQTLDGFEVATKSFWIESTLQCEWKSWGEEVNDLEVSFIWSTDETAYDSGSDNNSCDAVVDLLVFICVIDENQSVQDEIMSAFFSIVGADQHEMMSKGRAWEFLEVKRIK